MKKLFTKPFRFGLDALAGLVRMNADAVRYLLGHSLRQEVLSFADKEIFAGYLHIEKACEVAKKLKLDRQTVADVGAADGTTAALFLRELPAATVYVFEPLPSHLEALRKRFGEERRVRIFESAIGDSDGRAVLHIAERVTSSSLLSFRQDSGAGIPGSSLHETGSLSVPVTTLDSAIAGYLPLSILKMDVQGYEREVLRGASKVLQQTAVVVLEVNNHEVYVKSPKYFEIDQILRDAGYRLYDLFPSTKDVDGRLEEWDVLYLNNKYS